MKFELEPYNRNVPDDVLIQDVVEVAQRLGRGTLTMREYEMHGKYHPCTLQRRFKSWFRVLEKANLVDSRSRFGIADEELFNNLKDVWIYLGRQPKYVEVKKPLSKYSSGTYESRFSTWRKALEAFVKFMNNDSLEGSIPQASETPQLQTPPNDTDEQPSHKTKREISERMRFSILLRDGFRCYSCGRSPITCPGIELNVDHIIPWSKGGETVPENLQTKCRKCNLGKGNAFDK